MKYTKSDETKECILAIVMNLFERLDALEDRKDKKEISWNGYRSVHGRLEHRLMRDLVDLREKMMAKYGETVDTGLMRNVKT